MNSLFIRRVLAFSIDYMIIIIYAVLLFLVSTLLTNNFDVNLNFESPFKNQILGFFSLTLPIFLYFYLSEKSSHNATIGKEVMRLKVIPSNGNIFLRNFLKFLPWEIAHMGVYQVVFYDQQQLDMPIWVWGLLIVPQAIVLGYILSVLRLKGVSSIYDKISNTRIKLSSK
ncbi:RDD family protein [Flavobacteriaceae bacterium S356]|uniref:RDD family protein n=1 Tax=Asprobacillus argus TaxID=3076534 RepID=A0ABU3LGT5_9FLAO|nr:RDD family protein [Flavobacteriaceae bacterium S356]